jgi:type IV secretory pathway protease TraF
LTAATRRWSHVRYRVSVSASNPCGLYRSAKVWHPSAYER